MEAFMKRAIKIGVALALLGALAMHSRLYMQDSPATPVAGQPEQRFLTNNEILGLLVPDIASGSVARAAQLLSTSDIPLQQKIEVMRALVANDASGLTHDDLVMLILAVANNYAPNSPDQQAIFKVLADNYEKLQETRPLMIAGQRRYSNVLESLIAWSIANVAHYKKLKADLAMMRHNALVYMITEGNDTDAFRTLLARIGDISPQEATDLAWLLVKQRGNIIFLPELKKIGANLESVLDGKTMLVYAVMDNNFPLVKSLIELGVNPSAFGDPAIGRPVQQAFDLGFKDIEAYLREHGAREI
jgi:hypothetical protein